MQTKVKTGSMNFPYSLGKLLPGGTTACIPVTANILPVNNDGSTPDYMFNRLFVRANPANTGNIYICNSAAAPDTVNYTNVLDILTKGQSWDMSKEWANNRDISKVYIGADNGADWAVGNIHAF